MSPTLDFAVFSGLHALHAVDAAGSLRWTVRHACWEGSCVALHDAYEDYADSADHRHHDDGSCWVGADGSTVWAHVRTPLAEDIAPEVEPVLDEQWLVLDAADGRVLGRASIATVAAGSHHVAHPDPGQMGLGVGEGQDGVPLCWGRWDGRDLTVTRIGDDDRFLFDVSPDGTQLVTVAHAIGELALHRLPDGAVTHEIAAYDHVAPHPMASLDPDDAAWDYQCGFVDDRTVIASTGDYRTPEHWLIDAVQGEVLGQVAYPVPASQAPMALGDGTWLTSGEEDPFQLQRWRLSAAPSAGGRSR